MNSEEIIRILKSEPLTFTYDEIEQMMSEELAKDPDEMDTDFVDLCADVLFKALSENTGDEQNNKSVNDTINEPENENKKRPRIKLIKIIAIAAVIAVILGTAVTTFAKYIKNDASDEIVKFNENRFTINLKDGNMDADQHSDSNAKLIEKLNEIGFEDIILPQACLSDDYTYDIVSADDTDILNATITFTDKNENTFGISIIKYKNGISPTFSNNLRMTDEYDSATQLTLNGLDILVFGNSKYSSIIYIDKNTEYDIYLNSNFDSAIEIAESMEVEK